MCLGVGAPGGVKTISDEGGKAYGTAIDQAKTEFGAANTVFNDLMTSLGPIAAKGPLQTGETAQQAAAINATTVDQTATQYRNAATTVREAGAARGGGNVALPSGVNIATEVALAEAGAQQESTGLRENLQQNYELGNKNWQFAEKGIQSAPGVFSTANQATGEATNAGKQAFDEQQARAAYPTWGKIAMGAIGDVAGMASSMIPGGTLLEKGVGAGLDAVQSSASNQANG